MPRLNRLIAASVTIAVMGCFPDSRLTSAGSTQIRTSQSDVLEGAAFHEEFSKALRSLNETAKAETGAVSLHTSRVLLLKVLRDVLASGEAMAMSRDLGRETLHMTLEMVEVYFTPGREAERIKPLDALRRVEAGDDSPAVLDALTAHAIAGAVRTAACYSYRKDNEVIVNRNLKCSGDAPRIATGCTTCWISCRVIGGGIRRCTNCCDNWFQMEVTDPADPGIVYVFCVNDQFEARSCPPAI
jgi:hypothetical protein